MRARVQLLIVISMLLWAESGANAQEPAPVEADRPLPPHWLERGPGAPPTPPPGPVIDVGQEHWLVVQFMLGTEAGIRFQLGFDHACDHTWAGELFLGAAATRFGVGGVVGVGGRVHYTWMSGRWSDALLVSPGIDVFVLGGHDRRRGILEPEYPKEDVLFLAPTVDISWLHDFTPHFGWELGLHVGLGVGLAGRDYRGESAGGMVTPLLSLYTGFRL
jgi:hypothetical protein